jgi:endonuclease III
MGVYGMIDPVYITNFNRTRSELEEFWIFAVCVAGKQAKRTAKAVDMLLQKEKGGTPMQKIARMIDNGLLEKNLREIGTGQYSRIVRALTESRGLDLTKASVKDLEAIHGIGPKTARFFLLHSRKGIKLAALDTHLKRYVKDQGQWNVVRGQGTEYEQIERIVLRMAQEKRMSPAKFDLWVWRKYSGNQPKKAA